MKFGEFFKDKLSEQGRTVRWLAEQLDINEKTLAGKFNRNKISDNELITIARILNISLDEIKPYIHIDSFIIPENKLFDIIQMKNWIMLYAILDMVDQYAKYCTSIIIEKDYFNIANPTRIVIRNKDEYELWKKKVKQIVERQSR